MDTKAKIDTEPPQTIRGKADLIGFELINFNVVCLTKTLLGQLTSDEALKIDRYKFVSQITIKLYVSLLRKIHILVVEPNKSYQT